MEWLYEGCLYQNIYAKKKKSTYFYSSENEKQTFKLSTREHWHLVTYTCTLFSNVSIESIIILTST